MPPKNGLYLITKHPLFCGIGDFLKAKNYYTGNDWYAGMQ